VGFIEKGTIGFFSVLLKKIISLITVNISNA